MTAANWYSSDEGKTIGLRGTEDGTITRDEEHPEGSRMTLERDARTPFAITCGIYGWAVHTCFFSDEATAQSTFEEMKVAVSDILRMLPYNEDPELEAKCHAVAEAISAFVKCFS